jgi:transposase
MKKIHTLEEKLRAIRKANKPGVLAKDVANEIGIHTFSLYRWKKELRDYGLNRKMNNKQNVKNKLEYLKALKRLEKENKQLKMENDVLKKLKELDDAQKKKSLK